MFRIYWCPGNSVVTSFLGNVNFIEVPVVKKMEERSVMDRTTNTAKPRIFSVIYKIVFLGV